jgi:uncharacterized secreted protein with C-terminal beta-propeller domain
MKKEKSRMKNITILLAAAIVALLIAACQPIPPGPVPDSGGTQVGPGGGTYNEIKLLDEKEEIKTLNFQSDAEFSNFILNNAGGSNYYYSGGMMTKGLAVESIADVAMSAPRASGDAAESREYSTTNNQVQNVDEADIIKTDGNYIYTISGTTLYIVKAYPGEDAETVSKIKFTSRPQGLFVQGDKLAVFGSFYDLDFFKEIDFIPRQGMTYFNIYDISDKEDPELVKEYKFEGNYFQARMNNDFVYFVTLTSPEYRRDYPTPLYIDGTVKQTIPARDIYYFPIPYDNPQLASIHAINMKTNQKTDSKSVTVEYGQNMYMSEDNIYITYTKYINEWQVMQKVTIDMMMDKLTESDKALVKKIKSTDNEVLSQGEKEQKILNIVQTYISYMPTKEQEDLQEEIAEETQKRMDEYEYREWTIINKVAVSDGEVSVKANGKVPGHLVNQFSLDENKGVLRVATTISAVWNWRPMPMVRAAVDAVMPEVEPTQKESTNNIYTLDEDLEIMDSLTGLAPGEQIYSTRFMGERLYMVTFRQVDPFFVIDLKDPEDIKELGKLKIPGFSRYLHPYDDNTVIGIGRDASATTGQTRGLKISLFDVTDVENPKEVAKFVTDEKYAQSTAEYEHKAFLFNKEKQLLVIPAYNYAYDWRGETSEGSYNGAMVFKITRDDIEMRGIIDHSQGKKDYYYYGATVERSLFIEDLLYTKSEGLMRINKLSDLSKVKNIEFEGADSPYPVY